MKHVGIVIADRGSAIVHVEHDGAELLATAIERLPFSLTAVADRVAELDRELVEARFVIDAEGLGSALWAVLRPGPAREPVHYAGWSGSPFGLPDELDPPDDAERWRLYAGRGLERQALVDALLVAVHEGRFHFAPNLPEQEAMTKALQSYRRQVREDGIVGSELVVALLLALMSPPIPPNPPLAAWGGQFDEDRGVVGGLRVVEAPDGSLVGIVEPEVRP